MRTNVLDHIRTYIPKVISYCVLYRKAYDDGRKRIHCIRYKIRENHFPFFFLFLELNVPIIIPVCFLYEIQNLSIQKYEEMIEQNLLIQRKKKQERKKKTKLMMPLTNIG